MRLLILSLLLVSVGAVIGLGVLLDYGYQKIYQPTADPILKSHKNALINLARAQVDETSSNSITFTDIDSFLLPAELAQSLQQGEAIFLQNQTGFSLHLYLPERQQVANFDFPYALQPTQPSDHRLLFTLLFYAGIVLLICIWLSPLIKRLIKVRRAMNQLGQGQLEQRISVSQFSYIADIEKGFNDMAQQIQTLVEDNKLLSRAVSHDLRTPLSRLRFGLDWLEEKTTNADQLKHIERLSHDLDEMSALVETLLKFARLEQNKVHIKAQNYSLSDQLISLLAHYQVSHPKISFDTSRVTAQNWSADKNYIQMLLNNLFSNAVQHAHNKVWVSLWQEKGQICLQIEDDGQGIDESLQNKVFLPFYRGKASSGFGMGLAIVARIAQWHDIKVKLSRSSHGGLQVQMLKGTQ